MNIKASSIMDKYLGESDKMVSAIFRVARKLAPTVVFIDEIDTVLRKRGGLDNAGVQSMQVCKLFMKLCIFVDMLNLVLTVSDLYRARLISPALGRLPRRMGWIEPRQPHYRRTRERAQQGARPRE